MKQINMSGNQGVKMRRKVMVSSIKEKINEMGMLGNARRFNERLENKNLHKLMKHKMLGGQEY